MLMFQGPMISKHSLHGVRSPVTRIGWGATNFEGRGRSWEYAVPYGLGSNNNVGSASLNMNVWGFNLFRAYPARVFECISLVKVLIVALQENGQGERPVVQNLGDISDGSGMVAWRGGGIRILLEYSFFYRSNKGQCKMCTCVDCSASIFSMTSSPNCYIL